MSGSRRSPRCWRKPLRYVQARRRFFISLLRAIEDCDPSGVTSETASLHERALHGHSPAAAEWRRATGACAGDTRPAAYPAAGCARGRPGVGPDRPTGSTAACAEAAAEAAAWEIADIMPDGAEHDATLLLADLCVQAVSLCAGERLGQRVRPFERANAAMLAGRCARAGQRKALLAALRGGRGA